jgi:hypothetical protein
VAGQTVGADGRRTYLVRRRNDLALALGTAATGDGALDELDTVTVDRAGRPLDLGILRGDELSGSVSLPRVAQPAAGFLDVPSSGARRWEAEQHLDLTEPENLAAAGAFLAQVKAPHPRLGRAVAVSAALRRALDERGVLDVRTFAMTDTSSGVDAGVRVGVGPVGAGYERRTRSARLVAAMQRGPDGLWRRRADCVGDA